MIKRLLFLALSAILSMMGMLLHAQPYVYVPFAIDSAQWGSISSSYQNGNMGPAHETKTESRYFLAGDSLVFQGKRYVRLYLESSQTFLTFGFGQPGTGSIYLYRGAHTAGGLREEQQKAYFWPIGDTAEFVLHDFTLSVGDSIAVYKSFISPFAWVVAIDTVAAHDGSLRRSYTFSLIKTPGWTPFNQLATIVEGIGRTDGGLIGAYFSNYYPCAGPPGGAFSATFGSYCQGGQQIWGDSSCQSTIEVVEYPYQVFGGASKAKWLVNTHCIRNTAQDYLVRDYAYLYHADSGAAIIRAGKTYRSLSKDEAQYNITYSNGALDTAYTYIASTLIGGFRDDAKKIYYWDDDKQQESLVTDFSLRPGDTLRVGEPLTAWVLLRIDTAYQYTLQRQGRVFRFQNKEGRVVDIVEGCGVTSGNSQSPMHPFAETSRTDSFWTDIAPATVFTCVDGALCYTEYPAHDCAHSLPGPPVPGLVFADMTVYPNPVTDVGTVCFTEEMRNAPGATVTLLGADGRIYHQAPLTETSLVLRREELPFRLYFCRYSNDAGLVKVKPVLIPAP